MKPNQQRLTTIIHNGKVITPRGILEYGSVVTRDGKILDVLPYHQQVADAVLYDAGGNYIAPGFIDLHIHGGGGFDFMDATGEAFRQIADIHLRHGTTAMMPTTLTSTNAALEQVLSTYASFVQSDTSGMHWLGMHIEGPYFALNHRGAQDPRFIRNPDKSEYSRILEQFNCISRWSVAPELDGALEMGRVLSDKGIIASIAHTDAIYEDVVQAVQNGYSLVTHLYSGMNGVIRRNAYRYAGTVEAAFLIDELDVEIIADGKHLPVPLLQLVYRIKGAEKIALITDAIRPTGTAATTSVLGSMEYGLPVIIEDAVAKLPDRSSFAGSVATADRLVRVMWKEAGIPLPEVIKMACNTPARIAGIEQQKGEMTKGKDADIVVFDNNVNIQQTFIAGKPMLV